MKRGTVIVRDFRRKNNVASTPGRATSRRRAYSAAAPGLALAVVAATLVSGDATGGTFPGSNGRIVFDRDSRVFTVNPDGSGEFPITPAEGSASAPSVSADGNRVAYAFFGNAGYGIWVVNANGTGPTR